MCICDIEIVYLVVWHQWFHLTIVRSSIHHNYFSKTFWNRKTFSKSLKWKIENRYFFDFSIKKKRLMQFWKIEKLWMQSSLFVGKFGFRKNEFLQFAKLLFYYCNYCCNYCILHNHLSKTSIYKQKKSSS